MYLHNADGITRRVKSVLADAFEGLETARGERLVGPASEQVLARALEYAKGLENRGKADRMRLVLETYLGGLNIDEVVRQTGIPKGTASAYLNEVQKAIGLPVVRIPRLNGNRAGLQADRARGLRRASIRDFHSFRVTWITLALAAGVPLELVQRVTGHRTVEVVMKHYFRPGREDFRAAIMKAMPRMLAEQRPGPIDTDAVAILRGMTAETWRRDREVLLRLLAPTSSTTV
jgi:integrase